MLDRREILVEVEPIKFQGTRKFLAGTLCGIVLTAVTSLGEDLSDAARNKTDQKPNYEPAASAADASSNQHEVKDAAVAWDKFMDAHAEGIQDIDDEQLELLHRIALARVEDEGCARVIVASTNYA